MTDEQIIETVFQKDEWGNNIYTLSGVYAAIHLAKKVESGDYLKEKEFNIEQTQDNG